MAIEIERKFLVTGDGWHSGVTATRTIRQGYLSQGGPASLRVRIVDGGKAMLTIKSERIGAARQEFEYPIPAEDAAALLALAGDRLVVKRRHLVPVSGTPLTWEVDIFEGSLAGLVIAEIELDRPDRALALPAWVGREVTADPRYYNESLAAGPPPA